MGGLSFQEPLKAHSPFTYCPLIELGQLDVIVFFRSPVSRRSSLRKGCLAEILGLCLGARGWERVEEEYRHFRGDHPPLSPAGWCLGGGDPGPGRWWTAECSAEQDGWVGVCRKTHQEM